VKYLQGFCKKETENRAQLKEAKKYLTKENSCEGFSYRKQKTNREEKSCQAPCPPSARQK